MTIKSLKYIPVLLLFVNLALPVNAATFTVTNNSDAGAGSLRQAITDSNANAGADIIEFNIPGFGPHIIQLLSTLPDITDTVDINGYSEPGAAAATAANNAKLKIKLDGTLAGVFSHALSLNADNSRVKGLLINNFNGPGIIILGDNNLVRGCYIGTNKNGTQARPNGSAGITISGNNNEIGGTSPAHLNLISANLTSGVYIAGDSNTVHGNIIGLDISTTIDLGNDEAGVSVYGNNNLIGGAADGAGNVISGNSIGVLFGGTGANNQLQGNIIGTDITGTSNALGLGNVDGVVVGSLGANEVGGTVPEARNIISNNIDTGVEVVSDGNIVQGNYIGTDINGASALANGSAGILLNGNFNSIGGVVPEARNIISGNDSAGIYIQPVLGSIDKPRFNKVQGNYIGTDVTGTVAIANGYSGIFMTDADGNLIGGSGEHAGNLISGNVDDGILIRTLTDGLNSNANLVLSNIIGADASGTLPLANTSSGIRIDGSNNNVIGGSLNGIDNLIAYNGLNGVTIESGHSNAILGNRVHSNSVLGIDLSNDGVTANDLSDVDAGPNNLQNFVTITSATAGVADITIAADLNSAANTTYRVEFFSSVVCDASGHGEAEEFIGAVAATTDALGNSSGTHTFNTIVPVGHFITATVTQVSGIVPKDTSEFSACVSVL